MTASSSVFRPPVRPTRGPVQPTRRPTLAPVFTPRFRRVRQVGRASRPSGLQGRAAESAIAASSPRTVSVQDLCRPGPCPQFPRATARSGAPAAAVPPRTKSGDHDPGTENRTRQPRIQPEKQARGDERHAQQTATQPPPTCPDTNAQPAGRRSPPPHNNVPGNPQSLTTRREASAVRVSLTEPLHTTTRPRGNVRDDATLPSPATETETVENHLREEQSRRNTGDEMALDEPTLRAVGSWPT